MLLFRAALCAAVLICGSTAGFAGDLPKKGHHNQPSKQPQPAPTPSEGPPPGIRAVGTFPTFDSSNVYTVTAPDATLYIKKLFIPKGATIKVAPDVRAIDWAVDEFVFEENATIDLASNAAKAGRGGDGGPPGPQQEYCRQGARGQNGGGGATGLSGTILTIRDLRAVTVNGSLWIRTDGSAGGDGGNGGQGQQGGGHDKRGLLGHCKAANGGNGGSGGSGGAGGATSPITLAVHDNIPLPNNAIKAGCATVCTPSTRPPGAINNTGVIAVWGSPGCGGNGGAGGPGGLEGDRGESNAGANGGGGSAGPMGACSGVRTWGDRVPMKSAM